MSKKKIINTPPVIRVFLSSTFADMEHERSYFGEVLAPKLSRICAERGVSFFSVDLRWGITKEDQIGGQVLPICLGEIDKCRPYFIGIIGNRYGSIMEKVPAEAAQNIPWLDGKDGISITELEMLYAVLDHEKKDPASNSAFYIRSDRLSKQLYPSLEAENETALEKLDKLKSAIRSDSDVICSDYDSIEEFGKKVLGDLLRWLDENFPESGDVAEIRREWYNGEILRGYIENPEMNGFLDSYISSSRRSLLIHGDGARGKTAFLTAWEPNNAKKILINCASDEAYADWTAIALRILSDFCGFLSEDDSVELREIIRSVVEDCNGSILGESGRERFRDAVLDCLNALDPDCHVAVVINDLNLLSDELGRLLSWLPTEAGKRINYICSTNSREMVENADILGWNTKEMPLFSDDRARELVNNSLRVYGKNLSVGQFSALMSSVATRYPGQLRFVISFLLNHGRFDNLNRITNSISNLNEVSEIYRYVYDFLTADISEREKNTAKGVFGLLRASDIALSEQDCFVIVDSVGDITHIEWARVCRIFEQFDLIHGDYWYIRGEEIEKFVDALIPEDEMKAIHSSLAIYLYDKLCDELDKGENARAREAATYAKQTLKSFRNSGNYDHLESALGDIRIISNLIGNEPSELRSAWLELFLETDRDIGNLLLNTVKEIAEISHPLATELCKMIRELDMLVIHKKACEAIGADPDVTVTIPMWAAKLSDKGRDVYDHLYGLKAKGHFRELSNISSALLASGAEGLNETDICKILFFKANAEERLGSYEAELATANKYYKNSLMAGYIEDMQSALSMRASALYRLGKAETALRIVEKTGKMAYKAGKMRDHLSSLNMTALCYYRTARYDQSIEIFDKLTVYWNKIGNMIEVSTTVVNKCNALYLSNRIEEALKVAEQFYAVIENDNSMLASIASLSGNIGTYALDLDQFDKAEEALLRAIRISSQIGAEATLANAYNALGNLYRKTDSFKNCIELYAEQMEFLWKRGEYALVMEIYHKSFTWLSTSNHKKQAAEFEEKWRKRFSQIEGGLAFFESKSEKHAADAVTAEKLLEKAKIAASEGNRKREAQIMYELSEVYKKDDPLQAIEYLINAAMNYSLLNDKTAKIEALEEAINIIFNKGQLLDAPTFDNIIEIADDDEFAAIALIRKKIGELACGAEAEKEQQIQPDDNELEELITDLMHHKQYNEYLAVCCIIDNLDYIVKNLSADTMIALINSVSYKYRSKLDSQVNMTMGDEMDSDISYLMQTYFGARADMLIARYEKYVRVLSAFDYGNAPSVAGNLALIFRRRKEKEKAFAYHELSANLFRREGKMDDCFIEIMNGATARKELSDVSEAIEILRHGLIEALEYSNGKFAAMIAGNLASDLMTEMKEEDLEEIERCFSIEENYFRKSGYHRDLVISLVNQCIYYVKNGKPVSAWKEKLEEARNIINKANLNEFATVLSQLEWYAADASKSGSTEDRLRENVKKVFENSGYSLHSFERTDNYYYVIAIPVQDEMRLNEAIHAAIPFDSDCCMRLVAIINPSLYKEKSDIGNYIRWWNGLGKYDLKWNKAESSIQAGVYLHASDWEGFAERFANFLKMWEADKVNILALITGIADLDNCRQIKLKTIEQ